MNEDKALEVALNVLHQVRRGERVFLPYTEVVEVIRGVESARSTVQAVADEFK